MKVIHLNTYDSGGGAAKAAVRLNSGLRDIKVNSELYVQKSTGAGRAVGKQDKISELKRLIRPHVDRIPLNFYKKRTGYFSINWLKNPAIPRLDADIIHLHWINDGFLGIKNFPAIKGKLIWTLHDSWAFTGGCHLPYDCVLYKTGCGNCPQLASGSDNDLTRRVWKLKKKNFDLLEGLTIVAPSNWLLEKASQSALLHKNRIVCIPNGIDTNVYKPIAKKVAREILNLPLDKKVLLFGAASATSDPNKGYLFIKEIIQHFLFNEEGYEVVIFGADRPANAETFLDKVRFVGRLYDEYTLAILYSAADIFVSTSKSENLPNTIIESMSCGTLAAAFNVGGIADIIDDGKNGALIEPFDIKKMVGAIKELLFDAQRYNEMVVDGRTSVLRKFEIGIIANKYKELYTSIIDKKI